MCENAQIRVQYNYRKIHVLRDGRKSDMWSRVPGRVGLT
jgi:hypothetical protein